MSLERSPKTATKDSVVSVFSLHTTGQSRYYLLSFYTAPQEKNLMLFSTHYLHDILRGWLIEITNEWQQFTRELYHCGRRATRCH